MLWLLLLAVAAAGGGEDEAMAALARATATRDPAALQAVAAELGQWPRLRSAAHLRAGNALLGAGRLPEALSAFQQSLVGNNDYFPGRLNLALTLKGLGRVPEAATAAEAAGRLRPTSPLPVRLSAEIAMLRGDPAAAADLYARALELDPGDGDSLLNLAAALDESGRKREAVAAYEELLRRAPALSLAACNLAVSRRTVCAWRDYDGDVLRVRRALERELAGPLPPPEQPPGCLSPFHSLMMPFPPELELRLARRYAEAVLRRVPAPSPVELPAGSVLTVGFLSSDLRESPTGNLLRGLLGALQADARVRTVGYSTHDAPGCAVQAAIRGAVDSFVDASAMGSPALAARVRGDGVDVLLDVNGWLQGAPTDVLARRPAARQVAFLAYPGTTGAPWTDAVVADRVVARPAAARRTFSERLLLLGGGLHMQTNDYRRTTPVVPCTTARPVVANFNALYKLDPASLSLWVNVVRRVPGASLWLTNRLGDTEANVRAEAGARGLAAAALEFSPKLRRPEHLARCGCADLFLDSLTLNAHSTAADVLYQGVPVVTVPGDRVGSRLAAGLLEALGMPELVAPTVKAAEDMAVRLLGARGAWRARVEAQREASVLFDEEAYARGFARAMRGVREAERGVHVFG